MHAAAHEATGVRRDRACADQGREGTIMSDNEREQQHNLYDLGLQADLAMWTRKPIERRRILKMGALGIGILLAGCGTVASTASQATSTTAPATSAGAPATSTS